MQYTECYLHQFAFLIEIQGDKKYGLMCMVASVLITGMGVTLFFNKFLIRLGNVSYQCNH
jgi:hypothetical protein